RGLEALAAEGGVLEHPGVALVHALQSVAQFGALVSQPHTAPPTVVHRALLRQMASLDQFLNVVRHIGAEIAAAQNELADAHLGAAHVEQHQCLYGVDVVTTEPVEITLNDFKEISVEPLNESDHFNIFVMYFWCLNQRLKVILRPLSARVCSTQVVSL